MTPQYKALQCCGVFACHCQISPGAIEVGLLAVEPESFREVSGKRLTLYDPEAGDAIAVVQIPRLTAYTTTQITLTRYD